LLPVQSWDQYTDDLFGHETFKLDLEDCQSFSTVPETLRETQQQIELWTTGNVPLPSPDQIPPIEEAYICYGTVSHSTHVVLCLLHGATSHIGRTCSLRFCLDGKRCVETEHDLTTNEL
jgi:hypothetical protein